MANTARLAQIDTTIPGNAAAEEITAADINTVMKAMVGDVDTQATTLTAAIATAATAANAYTDAQIADLPPGGDSTAPVTVTFNPSFPFTRPNTVMYYDAADGPVTITPNTTGAVDTYGGKIIVLSDGDPDNEPVVSGMQPCEYIASYDLPAGHSTAYIFEMVGTTPVYAVQKLGAAVVVPVLSTPAFSVAAVSSSQNNLTGITYDSDSEAMVIRRATNSGMSANLTTIYTGVPKASHNDTGLTAATTYYYDLGTTATGFTASNKATGNATTSGVGLTPLTPPVLTMTPASDTAMDMSWTNPANEDGFTVRIASDSGFTANVQTASKAANTTTHQFTGLTASTSYYGEVIAEGDGVTYSDSSAGTDSEATNAPADVTPPTLVSATVADSTPTHVDLVFSEAMNATWSAAAAFTVTGHTVTAVTRTGATTGYLTASAAFTNGEAARTVSYTQPVSNKMQDLATTPNFLASFSGQAITNNVQPALVDITFPTYAGGVLTYSAGPPRDYSGTAGTYAVAPQVMPGNGYLQDEIAGGGLAVIALDEDGTQEDYQTGATSNFKYMSFLFGGKIYVRGGTVAQTDTGVTYATGYLRKFLVINTSVTLVYSSDNGVTWLPAFTGFDARTTATTPLYIKGAWVGGGSHITNPKGSGVV